MISGGRSERGENESLQMTVGEREAFADVHVGVRRWPSGAAAHPCQFGGYEPGGDVVHDRCQRAEDGRLRAADGNAVAQREALPYAYVTAEGPLP
jgi:hypothetical protein